MENIDNAISSPESAAGQEPCNLPGGRKKSRSGPDRVRANRSVRQAKDSEIKTPDISGQNSEGLSPSAVLQLCLENRLKVKLDVNGSPEYKLTWKHWDICSQLRICALRASRRRTGDRGFTGWVSPTVVDGRRGNKPPRESDTGVPLSRQVIVALYPWPTCQVESSKGINPQRVIWSPLGKAYDVKTGRMVQSTIDQLLKGISGWGPPTARDAKDGETTLENTPINGLLGRMVLLAAWSTPQAGDSTGAKISPSRLNAGTGLSLKLHVHGMISTSSNAQTKSSGALNPEFSRWLMGYPPEWLSCVDWETLSSRKLRRSLSGR